MLTCYKIENNRIVECAKEDAVLSFYAAPSAEEINELVSTHHLHEYDVHSSLDLNELSRLDFDDDYTLVIIKNPRNYSAPVNLLFEVNSIGIFLFKNKMIVVTDENLQLFEKKQTLKIKTLNDILIKILYTTIMHFVEHLKVMDMIAEELEQKINQSMGNKYLLMMFKLEKSLVYYLEGVNSNAKVIDKIKTTAAKLGFTEDNVELIEDIQIENQQCQKQTEIYLSILTGLMDARGSIVGNNLSVLIKRLTIVSIVFMPLYLLAGIGGMSEFSMMTQSLGWKVAYPLFLLGLATIGTATYFLVNFMIKRFGTEE